MIGKKRLALAAGSMTAVAAAASLIAGTTFGLFSATAPSQNNTFSTGTVTLDQTATTACTFSNIVPGDTASDCNYTATYTGSTPAWMAVDVVIATSKSADTSGIGGTPAVTARDLYDPSGSSPKPSLTLTSNSGAVTYSLPTTADGSCPAEFSTADKCYHLNNLLVSTSTFSNTNAVTFVAEQAVGQLVGNAYQNASTTIKLTAHAVQSAHNSIGTDTAGAVSATPSWS